MAIDVSAIAPSQQAATVATTRSPPPAGATGADVGGTQHEREQTERMARALAHSAVRDLCLQARRAARGSFITWSLLLVRVALNNDVVMP